MKRLLAVRKHSMFADLAFTALRGTAGLAFMFHGWGKIQSPTGWMGSEGPIPGVFQALAVVAELGGGLGWVLGLLTPLASLGIACTMAVAFATHAFMRGDPFVSPTGAPAYELATVYFCIALLLMAMGPGRFSADRAAFGER